MAGRDQCASGEPQVRQSRQKCRSHRRLSSVSLPTNSTVVYCERLRVPLRWWVQGTLLIASLWLAMIVAIPGWLPWAITAFAVGLMCLGFQSYAATIVLSEDELKVGKAHIGRQHLGSALALDADQTRLLAGVDADARAYLIVRPYLSESVRVEIMDPHDPAPYWLINTRRAPRLAEAIGSGPAQDRGPTAGRQRTSGHYDEADT